MTQYTTERSYRAKPGEDRAAFFRRTDAEVDGVIRALRAYGHANILTVLALPVIGPGTEYETDFAGFNLIFEADDAALQHATNYLASVGFSVPKQRRVQAPVQEAQLWK